MHGQSHTTNNLITSDIDQSACVLSDD